MGKAVGLILAVAMLAGLAACETRAPIERAMAMLEAQEPNLGLLRERDPAAYGQIRTVVETAIHRGQLADHDNLVRQTRDIFSRSMQKRLLTASDATVQQFALLFAEQVGHLEANPPVCVALLNGTAGDLRSFIPAEMMKREQETFRALLTETPMRHPAATAEEIAPVMQAILRDAEAALSMDSAQIDAALGGTAPPLDVCRANAFLVRTLGEMPAGEGAPLIRSLMRIGMEEEAQHMV